MKWYTILIVNKGFTGVFSTKVEQHKIGYKIKVTLTRYQ